MTEWLIPGLPERWPELIANALSELSNDEFEESWRAIGKIVRLRSREIRREVEAIDDHLEHA